MHCAKYSRLFLIILIALSTFIKIEAQAELSAREIARKSLPSVVLIICADDKDIAQGSGFFIRPGVLLTNYHVIEGMFRGFAQVATGKGEKLNFRIARIIAFDKEADLALLSVPAATTFSSSPLPLAAETYRVEVGETVYALGNPEGLVGTISPGIVSAGLRFAQKNIRIQITAPISHGSSGGPVVNLAGNVIGVAVASLSEGQNLNFAVPVSLIYELKRIARFPDDQQNSLDMVSDSRSTRLRPWAGPLLKDVGGRVGVGTNSNSSSGIANDSTTEQKPKTATDYFLLGESDFDKGLYAESISDYSKAIQLNPRLAIAYARRGVAFDRQRNFGLAIADYSKAIELDPKDFSSYNNRGGAYSEQGKDDLAIDDFTAAIQLNPHVAAIFRNRARCYREKTDFSHAIADYDKAVDIEPQNAYGYLLRGIAYDLQEKFGLAIADYSRAIQINTQYAEAFIDRGRSYSSQKKYDLAFADFAVALKINPQFAEAYYNRGIANYDQKNFEAAVTDYTKTIELKPQFADAYGQRGMAYDELAKYELAAADFTKALVFDPNDTVIYSMRAQTRLRLNDGDGAHKDASSYLRLNGLKGDLAPYAILVGYLGFRKSGKTTEANAFLNNWMKQVEAGSWTLQIMRFFNDQLTADQLIALAGDNDNLTEAHAYIGEMLLLASNLDAARSHFEWVRDHGNKGFTEYKLALSELKRLK